MPEIFLSEHAFNYHSYTFGYGVYAKRVGAENLENIYEQGFLPYSGDKFVTEEQIFYMARSLRVVLGEVVLSSENRRIRKKFDEGKFYCHELNAGDGDNDRFCTTNEIHRKCTYYLEHTLTNEK